MRVEIEDLADEGFTALSAEFDKHYGAGERLDRLYNNLHRDGDEALLHPLPRADRLVLRGVSAVDSYGPTQPLATYLEHLETITYAQVREDVCKAPEFKAWRDGVMLILYKQAVFAESVFTRNFDVLVALLRDMLPQYLIARWKNIPACALPLGRAYLDRFGPEYEAYDHITGALYGALEIEPLDFKPMWKLAREELRHRLAYEPCMQTLATALREEATPHLPKGHLLVLETGLQATMPLLFEGVFRKAIQWYMFTAAPWLLDIYRERLFFHQYAMLRPCETLTCTESLFKPIFENGAWLVQESKDALTQSLAYWEIVTLKKIAMG